jgi:hypothetical protein
MLPCLPCDRGQCLSRSCTSAQSCDRGSQHYASSCAVSLRLLLGSRNPRLEFLQGHPVRRFPRPTIAYACRPVVASAICVNQRFSQKPAKRSLRPSHAPAPEQYTKRQRMAQIHSSPVVQHSSTMATLARRSSQPAKNEFRRSPCVRVSLSLARSLRP